ncbi:non-contractile tail sheath protein [Roseixanthobacter pseudopolyaromaticivorans]|uniref:non-contractile tail sheath protein n=1 Tax=Xanthobacteraceae TaxID=335928 RepID=UPI0037284BED
MGYLISTPKGDRSDVVRRFTPKLWTLDMPLEASGSIRTVGPDGVDASAIFRRNGDIVGIMWNTDMQLDHPRFRYEGKPDYTGCVLDFDIELGGTSSRLDSLYGMSMVIDTADGGHYYVRLWNYRTDPSNTSPFRQSVRIPFTADLYGGYEPTPASASEDVKASRRVPTGAITRIMLPITPRDYLAGAATLGLPLSTGSRQLTIVTTNGATLSPGDVITIPTAGGGGTDLTIAGAVADPGEAVAHASDWGDVVFTWPEPVGVSNPTYQVRVFNNGLVVHSGTTTEPFYDFPVEASIPIYGFPPSWIRWEVTVAGDLSPLVTREGSVVLDNAFVTVLTPFGGQSNGVGHFTTLSGSNRDTCSAGTFRRKLAELYGIRAVQVMPLMVCWGSAAADKQADDDANTGENYWWDLNANAPGPRLLQAVSIIKGTGVKPDTMIWAQGENDVSFIGWPDDHGYPKPTIARLKSAWEAIFHYLREQVNPDLKIWIQKVCTSWYGNPPVQVLPDLYAQARAAQDQIATDDPLTFIGAENLALQVSDFFREDITYIHYATAIYHTLANTLAANIHAGPAIVGTGPLDGVGTPDPIFSGPPVVSNGGVHVVRTAQTYNGPTVPMGTALEVRTSVNVPLIAQNECRLSLRNIRVSGSNTDLLCDLRPEPAHRLRMTDGYDNCYNLSPEFVVDRVYSLGYRDHYVLYMGISHFHNFSWTGERWLLSKTGELVNTPTREWFTDFCQRLKAKGYALWLSISYEILAAIIPIEWQQVNISGMPGHTGWSPPSALVEPSNHEGATYLASVAIRFLGIMKAAGLPAQYQIGEPWWWDGSFTDGQPCVYSYATALKYLADTGNYAPQPYMTSTHLTPEALEVQRPYLEWLGRQLGESTNLQVSIVKATFPETKTAILVFTPQVLNPSANASAIMNLPPADMWGPTKFDVLQIEDYDWVTAGEFDLMKSTWVMAKETLGYPLDRIEYFSGYVQNHTDGYMWAYVDAGIEIGVTNAASQTYVWSREQVMRDGYIYQRRVSPSVTISTNAQV